MLLLGRGLSSTLLLASQSWEVHVKSCMWLDQAPLSHTTQGSEAVTTKVGM